MNTFFVVGLLILGIAFSIICGGNCILRTAIRKCGASRSSSKARLLFCGRFLISSALAYLLASVFSFGVISVASSGRLNFDTILVSPFIAFIGASVLIPSSIIAGIVVAILHPKTTREYFAGFCIAVAYAMIYSFWSSANFIFAVVMCISIGFFSAGFVHFLEGYHGEAEQDAAANP